MGLNLARAFQADIAIWLALTLILGGAGAMATGRALARTWQPILRLIPYALLLADSASHERTRAVMEVWRAKGLVPYALTQDDGSVRVYAGAFGTVAQGATMAALVHNAGGTPIVAYRTGRPD